MNDPAVYVAGNGLMAAAYRNGEILQVFGPPYSSPTLFSGSFLAPFGVTSCALRHMPGSAVWQIDLKLDNDYVGTVTDFALPEMPCLVRRIETTRPVTMRLQGVSDDGGIFHQRVPGGGDFALELITRESGAIKVLVQSRNGAALYCDYPLPQPQYFTFVLRGDVQLTCPQSYVYDIQIDGNAELLIIGGPDYPTCDRAVRGLEDRPYAQLLSDTLQWWRELMAGVPALHSLPQDMPLREQARQAVEDTVLNIVSQQASEGGVLAGYAYHMGYVRDQFGVCMAMLKLGLYDRARKMLEFYVGVFRKGGKICNAQAIGVPGIYHFAENEKTEITGYLLLQMFTYARITGDTRLLHENGDFLQWLYQQQLSQLHNDTLPFNGDETYIAGGLLPRDVINDGSAEATMLFLLSGEALLEFYKEQGLATEEMEAVLTRVRHAYTEHFVPNGEYILNDPERTKGMELPEYRYGVCMNWGAEGCRYLGWTKRHASGLYLCPVCQRSDALPPVKVGRYSLPSALLLPLYLGSDLPGKDIIRPYVRQLTDQLIAEGHVYSDQQTCMNVGYDYGLLLYNLVCLGEGGQEEVYRKMLSLLDEAGAWSEYYQQDRPAGTRYRAWESGINIDALLTYAAAFSKNQ